MAEDAGISIKIKTQRGGGENSVDLKMTVETTVGQLKAQIASSTLQVPPEAQRLVYQGRMLNDDTKTLAENRVKEGSCILLCITPGGASSSLSTSTSSSTSSSTSNSALAAAPPAPPLPTGATAAARAAPQALPPPSTSAALPAHIVILRAAIVGVRTSNPPEVGGTALKTLATMLGNVVANPMEEKYRQLKKNNAAFVRRVGGGKILCVLVCYPSSPPHSHSPSLPSLSLPPSLLQSLARVLFFVPLSSRSQPIPGTSVLLNTG